MKCVRVYLTITAMSGVIETFKTASYNSAINGDYARLTIAAGSLLFAYMVWLVVHSSTSWASGIFGGISANLCGAASTIALGGAAATYAGARAAGAVGSTSARGVAGAAGGVIKNRGEIAEAAEKVRSSSGFWSRVSAAMDTAWKTGVSATKGGFAAARGRGPALTSAPPRMGSGLRLTDSFRDGAAAVRKPKGSD